jgi:hypothetical protein
LVTSDWGAPKICSGGPSSAMRPSARKGDAVGEAAGKTHFVRDEEEVAALALDFLDEFEHLGGHFGIERGGRFVEEHDLRLDGNGPRDGDPLALAAGKLGGAFVGVVEQLETAERAFGQFPRFVRVRPWTFSSGSVMFRRAVRCGKRLKAWKTVPMERRWRRSASS